MLKEQKHLSYQFVFKTRSKFLDLITLSDLLPEKLTNCFVRAKIASLPTEDGAECRVVVSLTPSEACPIRYRFDRFSTIMRAFDMSKAQIRSAKLFSIFRN